MFHVKQTKDLDMNKKEILTWLQSIASGEMTPEEVYQRLEGFPYKDIGFAKIDFHRGLRNGNVEVVYCPGKTADQIVSIFKVLAESAQNVIATRAKRQVYKRLKEVVDEAIYFETAKIVAVWRQKSEGLGRIGIISAGTADLAVAEEAAITAEIMGSKVERIFDVGVAGIHRLLDKKSILDQCKVLVVVAGMEGALASVVGGLVSQPIIAVPTSIGYGAHFQGLTPLLSMLNSCASGVGVVNIDNGFGAGLLAHRINILGE